MSDDVSFLTRIMRESIELRARVALEKQEDKEEDWVKPFQVTLGGVKYGNMDLYCMLQ